MHVGTPAWNSGPHSNQPGPNLHRVFVIGLEETSPQRHEASKIHGVGLYVTWGLLVFVTRAFWHAQHQDLPDLDCECRQNYISLYNSIACLRVNRWKRK